MIQLVRKLKTDKRLEKKFDYIEFLNPDNCYYHLASTRSKKSEVLIEEGDEVKIGQVIAVRDGGFFKQNVHATISGKFVGTEKKLYRNNKLVNYMVIENDFKESYDERVTDLSMDEMLALDKEAFVDRIRENSNVGMGGSSFPTFIKFQTKSKINSVLINGVECEPYLVSDVNSMFKYADEIIKGTYLAMRFYDASEGVICVKAYKEKLTKHLNKRINELGFTEIKLCQTPNYYPQGYERDVIKTAKGVEVENGKMPADYGFMVFNSTSILAIYDSLKYNLPVLQREISLIGNGFNKQTDLTVKVGTALPVIIEKAGGLKAEAKEQLLVSGGPMMGTSLKSEDVVVTKAFSTLLTINQVNVVEEHCINCGSCVNSCPVKLQPVLINNALNARNKDALAKLNVRSCVECGLCSYVCTSKIDLTKKMRRAKRMI